MLLTVNVPEKNEVEETYTPIQVDEEVEHVNNSNEDTLATTPVDTLDNSTKTPANASAPPSMATINSDFDDFKVEADMEGKVKVTFGSEVKYEIDSAIAIFQSGEEIDHKYIKFENQELILEVDYH